MSIWNKVLLGLIIFASFFFIFFAMRALKTHQHWRQMVQERQKKLAGLEKENLALRGDDDVPDAQNDHSRGIRQATLHLHNLMSNRGRVWNHVTAGGFNAETGGLTVTTEQLNPSGMVGTVVFLFSEAPVKDGGRFLGQFVVTSQAEKQLQLQPSLMMTHAEVERLQKSPAPWVMYDIMPPDDHESLANLDEAALRALLVPPPAPGKEETPEEKAANDKLVAEYLNDGKPQPDGSKLARKLRDYGVLLTGYYRQRSILFEYLAAAKHDKHYLQDALAGARKQELFHNTEITAMKADLAEEERKLAAVQGHLQAVETKLAETRTEIAQLTQANRTLVGEIARIQIEATRQIDKRTQGMAQTTP